MRRRAQIIDILAILLICFAMAIVALFLSKFLGEFQTTSASVLGADSTTALSSGQFFVRSFDSGILFIFIIGILVAGALAFAIRSIPVAMVAIIFIGLVMLVVAPIFGNTYEQIGSEPTMSATANTFTNQANLWQKIPWFVMAGIFVILLMLFGKPMLFGG